MKNSKASKPPKWVVFIVLPLLVTGAVLYFYYPRKAKVETAPVLYKIQVPDSSVKLLAKDFATTKKKPSLTALTTELKKYITTLDSENSAIHVAVYFEDCNSHEKIGINENSLFNLGSIVKVPILIAGLKFIEEHPEIKNYPFKFEENKIPPTEPWDLPFFHPNPDRLLVDGHIYSFDEVFYKMIALSSNRAFSVTLEVAAEQFRALNDKLGKPLGDLALPQSTAANMAKYLHLLYDSSYLSEESSRKALYLMTQSDFNQGLQAGLPPGVRLAHKFGVKELSPTDRTLSECAIVYKGDNPYMLCVFTNGSNFDTQREILENVSRKVFSNFHY